MVAKLAVGRKESEPLYLGMLLAIAPEADHKVVIGLLLSMLPEQHSVMLLMRTALEQLLLVNQILFQTVSWILC